MLVLAFKRKLTFTVGYSVTRNKANCIVWNGVHHKTRLDGGAQSFGFPDDTYFRRVKEELKLKNVVFSNELEKEELIEEVTERLFMI